MRCKFTRKYSQMSQFLLVSLREIRFYYLNPAFFREKAYIFG